MADGESGSDERVNVVSTYEISDEKFDINTVI